MAGTPKKPEQYKSFLRERIETMMIIDTNEYPVGRGWLRPARMGLVSLVLLVAAAALIDADG